MLLRKAKEKKKITLSFSGYVRKIDGNYEKMKQLVKDRTKTESEHVKLAIRSRGRNFGIAFIFKFIIKFILTFSLVV